MVKKTILITVAILCGMLHGAILQPAKAAVAFPDVPSNHWAYSTIQWAVDNNVVNGYPDGTFRPSQQVTEAEFLTMFIRAFEELPKVSKLKHWADPAYLYAEEKNWPTMGAGSHELRSKAISREQVAEIIAGANGVNFLGTDAIQYLLNTELSKGKVDATIDGYKGADFLTRAEAVQFIKNLKDKGLHELQNRPELPTPKDQMPKPKDDANLPAKVREVKAKMEEVVSEKYPGFIVSTVENRLNITKGTKGADRLYASFNIATTEGGVDRVIAFRATKDESIKLAVEMLKAVGVPVKDDFFDTLKEAAQTGKESEHKVGNRELFVRPHPTNADHITIYIVK
jgi:S-layer homology domain.